MSEMTYLKILSFLQKASRYKHNISSSLSFPINMTSQTAKQCTLLITLSEVGTSNTIL